MLWLKPKQSAASGYLLLRKILFVPDWLAVPACARLRIYECLEHMFISIKQMPIFISNLVLIDRRKRCVSGVRDQNRVFFNQSTPTY